MIHIPISYIDFRSIVFQFLHGQIHKQTSPKTILWFAASLERRV